MASHPRQRRERLPFGLAHLGLETVERELPSGEPPGLAPNAELRVVGKNTPRWDARAKVTGEARYTVDVELAGMLHAAFLRSPFAHARILSVDLSRAMTAPGVRAAVQLAGPGMAGKPSVVRYWGQPVVALAADSPTLAEEALRRVRVEYQELPFAVDANDARKPDAPLVYDRDEVTEAPSAGLPATAGPESLHGNILGSAGTHDSGELALALERAATVVEATYRTQVQTHCCMEPHAIVASWQGDRLDVWMSTQFTAGVRAELAADFHLPLSRVRLRAQAIGGGFGSKSRLGLYGRAAVELSRLAAAPVRLVYTRTEEQIDSGNRPSSEQHLRIGAHADGTLAAIALESYGNAGVAFGAGVGFIAGGLYRCDQVETVHSDVFTHTAPSCAMRGPGNTQGAFAVEQCIDELAERLGKDPLELRDRIDQSAVRHEERRLGAERVGWHSRTSAGSGDGPVKHGLGVAQSVWPALVQTNAACEVRLWRDGAVEVLSSVQDIGTGAGTTLAQVVAEELGLVPDQIRVHIGDTEYPSGPPSYGSRTTASITPPARIAACRVKESLLGVVAAAWDVDASELALGEGRVYLRRDPGRRISWRDAAAGLRTDRVSAVAGRADDYGGFRSHTGDAAFARGELGGVQFAEVDVDTETGVIRVERVVAVHDCGRPINPRQVESQVQGGVLMGISYALLEERLLDPRTGRVLNPNFVDYKLLGAGEVPEIDVILLENYQGLSASDAYGVAEPANIPTAAAVANAVYNAIGVRLRSLPMTPAAVLHALGSVARGHR